MTVYFKNSNLLLLSGICINLKDILITVLLILSLLLGLYLIFSGHVLLGNFVGYLCLIIAGLIEEYWIESVGGNMRCMDNDEIEKRKKVSKKILNGVYVCISVSYIYIAIIIILFLMKEIDDYIPYVSIGLALFAITLAVFSLILAFNSDTKMIQITNFNFQQALEDFENARIYFIRRIYNVEAYIWRSRTHLEKAFELDKNRIKCKYHNRLIQYFNVTLETLLQTPHISVTWNSLKPNQQKNVKQIYWIARQYQRSGKRQENNFSAKLQLIGKRPNETEEQFYNRLFP